MGTSYKVDAFVKALADGLPKPSATVEGLVKSHADKKYLLFSPGSTCSFWVPVPAALIESIDHLGSRLCGGHDHELVRLHLKVPTTPEAEAFSELLGKVSAQPAAQITMSAVPTAHAGMPAGGGDTGIAYPPMNVVAYSATPQPASLASASGYRYTGITYGLGSPFGIAMPSAGYDPGRTPQCGYMSISGRQFFCRLVDFRWASGVGAVAWWFNNFEICA